MAVWTAITKNVATWANAVKQLLFGYLLKEDGYYLLLEDGGKIILWDNDWDNETKNTATYTNLTKH
jgi:hypothetical protein